ncbi:CDP-glycerol glycerophosphotransferase family protein [Vibrio cyclitrophicus]|uniref:CDP-glycerol glycerophosphotransferase family protein n=1 Tax=Vibrio cyclitrophicus TaxID=47951 RepID=UPI001C075E94|nr:CDP-glycerol glycerophosphotransferase family protein [Vibrio cyclitrophicus]
MKIKRFIELFVGLVIYSVSRCVPKSKNIWIFGAWHGAKYGDNSKALFEYILKEKEKENIEIQCIWVSKNNDVVRDIRELGYRAYNSRSFKGIYYICRGSVNVFNVSFNDISKYIPAPYLINLWHGTPLKKIGYDNTVSAVLNKNKINLLHKIFPFVRGEQFVDLAVASSNQEANNLSSAFSLDKSKIKVTGLPRNDGLLKIKKNENSKIIYMPTWREESSVEIASLLVSKIDTINDRLSKLGISLYVKPHPNNESDFKFTPLSNVKMYSDEYKNTDIYDCLNEFSMLITDYSSIYIDYLLMNRPIIFLTPDIIEYMASNRDFYYDFDKVTPGPKLKSWLEVLEFVDGFSVNQDFFRNERIFIRSEFHEYEDSHSSLRVFNEIKRLIGYDN